MWKQLTTAAAATVGLVITLALSPAQQRANAEANQDHAWGTRACSTYSTIRGLNAYGKVYQDLNRNGQLDDGEPGVAGAALTLMMEDSANPGEYIAVDAMARPLWTDPDGKYSFTSLCGEHTYRVSIFNESWHVGGTITEPAIGSGIASRDLVFTNGISQNNNFGMAVTNSGSAPAPDPDSPATPPSAAPTPSQPAPGVVVCPTSIARLGANNDSLSSMKGLGVVSDTKWHHGQRTVTLIPLAGYRILGGAGSCTVTIRDDIVSNVLPGSATLIYQVDSYWSNTTPKAAILNALLAKKTLPYRGDQALWQNSTHEFVTLSVPADVIKTELVSALNASTKRVTNLTAGKAVKGKLTVVAWQLGNGATVRHPWGVKKNILQRLAAR